MPVTLTQSGRRVAEVFTDGNGNSTFNALNIVQNAQRIDRRRPYVDNSVRAQEQNGSCPPVEEHQIPVYRSCE